ncbi:MAG: D-2-hydroxyacid dehydrogenase [Chloroflexota bacterium]|nr:D-2-hydroxyacid dehydrogenase [Chloroflexota bacterium]
MKVAIPETFRRELEERLPSDVRAAWYATTTDVAKAAHDADVLVMAFIDPGEIRLAVEAATKVRWVSTHAAGVDNYPLEYLREHRVMLTKGAGVSAIPIAESVVLCMLSAAKSFPYFIESSLRHEWPSRRPPAAELFGSKALIVGYGSIGHAVGERLDSFGVDVTGVRRRAAGEAGVIGPEEWRSQIGAFDWIVLTAALTAQTRHLIGAEELSHMKSSAWIVNVARGGLIDQEALAASLRRGRPRGAYLDVTYPEPLPAGHPLWSLPNVFISGHSAGRSGRALQRYSDLFLDNLRRFLKQEPLANLVDLSAGY